jgi:hypothetical protein
MIFIVPPHEVSTLCKHTIGNYSVNMGMPKRYNKIGGFAPDTLRLTTQLSRKTPVKPEVNTKPLGNCKYPLSVRNISKYFIPEPVT